ncbi:MAG TPA: type II secretion system F family protein [Candidatus Acidoferrales bacterium]|jgi:tight adherence protein C|nr:type II secretion system F family protein [Candidatus Acidoferrales bacterium]
MSTPLLLGILLMVVVGGLAAYYFLVVSRNDVHRRLAELNLDTAGPTENKASVSIHKLLDESQKRTLARRLSEAGWYQTSPPKFVMYSLVGGGIGMSLGVMMGFALGSFETKTILAFAVLTIAGFMGPNASLNRAIETRKKSVQRELPNFLDVVSTSVEAGTALSGAINVGAEAVEGALREELTAVMDDIRLGRSRGEALAAMAHRLREPDLTTTVTAIVQAEKLGGNITSVLYSLAAEARDRRMMRAEEVAAQLPVKMIFPMAGFMLPALMLLIFGGIIAQYYGK